MISIQYEAYWNNRGKTSMVWVALLFAILRIAVCDWIREGDEPIEYRGKCQDMAITFRNRLTDCLILSDYMQPHEHLVETMILHLYAEYVSSRDCRPSVWVLSGMIVRLAMRMGYHQETQPLLRNSPFHVSPPHCENVPRLTTSRPRCVEDRGRSSAKLISSSLSKLVCLL